MCVYSMIADHYKDKWIDVPSLKPFINPVTTTYTWPIGVSQEDFDKLKQEVIEMKKLLEKALQYDAKNNEPHCETEEKTALIKRIAELVGVSLEDLKI